MLDDKTVATGLWTWILGAGLAVQTAVLGLAIYIARGRGTREHLDYEIALRTAAEKELAEAKKRIDELTKLVDDYVAQLGKVALAAQFHEEGGVLFKRRPGGGYHDVVYCPECKRPLLPVFAGSLHCSPCSWTAPSSKEVVAGYRARLPA